MDGEIMEIKQTMVLDGSEPLSKALSQLVESPAVLVTKNGKYFGVIDHRSVGRGIKDPSHTKCESAVVRPPLMTESADMMERLSAFLLGHFKALPVVNDKEALLGITTRVELLKEMIASKLIPEEKVGDVMSSPAYTIEDKENIGQLRNTMKEKNVNKMIVTKNGYPAGVVSTFDIGSWEAKPNLAGGRKDIRLSSKLTIDSLPISDFLRPDITTIDEKETIVNSAKRMIEKNVSTVIVVSGKKPVGVLSALDIFKNIQEMAREKSDIMISGLGEDHASFYSYINEKLGHTLEKFGESFEIRNAAVHVKEAKSVMTVNLSFDTNEGRVSLRGERKTLKETIDELSVELDKILREKKEMRKERYSKVRRVE